MNTWSVLIVVNLITCGVFVSGQLVSGSDCTIETTKSQGVCKVLLECPEIIGDIKNNKTTHTRCGYSGFLEIVCCPIGRPKRATDSQEPRRISEKKCAEYNSLAKCPLKPESRILTAESMTQPGEFPHVALVGWDSEDDRIWPCNGALISDEYVLTVAHCLQGPHGKKAKYVRLGVHDIDEADSTDGGPEEYEVVETILHPEYNTKSVYNDIGLVRLNRKVNFDSHKRPACLPASAESIKGKLITAGWEQVSLSDSVPNYLRKSFVKEIPQDKCNSTYGGYFRKLPDGIKPETQICVDSKISVKGVCTATSGAPLQVLQENNSCKYTTVALLSLGSSCYVEGLPEIYTLVYPYLQWIENTVWGA